MSVVLVMTAVVPTSDKTATRSRPRTSTIPFSSPGNPRGCRFTSILIPSLPSKAKIPRRDAGQQCIRPVTAIGLIGRIGLSGSSGDRDPDQAYIGRYGGRITVFVKVFESERLHIFHKRLALRAYVSGYAFIRCIKGVNNIFLTGSVDAFVRRLTIITTRN